MSRLARSLALAALYEQAAAEMGEAIEAIEEGNRDRADAAMTRVMDTMNEIGAELVAGPILPLIPVH